MKMDIGDYVVESYPYGYTLSKKKVCENEKSKNYGMTILNTVGYYGTLPAAVKAIPENELKESDAKNVQSVCQSLDGIYLMIEKSLK